MSENDDPYKGEGNQNQNDQEAPKKPKKIKRFAKYDPTRSKSAPAVENIDEEEEKEEGKELDNNNDNGNNNYIASYNYYLYYNSLKPVDPRLPKPTYTPKANLEYIRESKKELEEDDPNEKLNPKENPQIESITNDIEKLNMDSNDDKNINNVNNNTNNINQNNSKNNQEDENYANFKKNYSQSQTPNTKFKNNNSNQDAPSPLLDYYSFNQQNNNHQMSPENIYSMPQIPESRYKSLFKYSTLWKHDANAFI